MSMRASAESGLLIGRSLPLDETAELGPDGAWGPGLQRRLGKLMQIVYGDPTRLPLPERLVQLLERLEQRN